MNHESYLTSNHFHEMNYELSIIKKNLDFTEKREAWRCWNFVLPYTEKFRFSQSGLYSCAVRESDTVHFGSTKVQPVPHENGHINYDHIIVIAASTLAALKVISSLFSINIDYLYHEWR